MKILNELLINAGDMSGDITSAAQQLDYTIGFSVQLVFAGSPVGTFKLQSSCDPSVYPAAPTNWDDITSSSQAISAAGSGTYNFNQTPGFKYVRAVYTRTSGTGTLNARINTKGF